MKTPTSDMNNQSPAVLWADDDPTQIAWITEALTTHFPHLNLVVKNNGLEALDYLVDATFLDNPPCLIVLDINMPHVDGKHALISIICNPELKKAPVVLFSASESKMDQLFSRMYQVPLIRKPADEHSFKRTVIEIVREFCTEIRPCAIQPWEAARG